MLENAQPALSVPNGSQGPPLCCRFPGPRVDRLTAHCFVCHQACLSAGWGVWSQSGGPSPCHSFFLPHMHGILRQKPHQSPRAFLTLSKYIHHSGVRLERRRRWQGTGRAESGEGALGHLPSPSRPCSPRPKELLSFHSSVPSVQGSDGDL